jgi:hypothetical protein
MCIPGRECRDNSAGNTLPQIFVLKRALGGDGQSRRYDFASRVQPVPCFLELLYALVVKIADKLKCLYCPFIAWILIWMVFKTQFFIVQVGGALGLVEFLFRFLDSGACVCVRPYYTC